MAVQGPILEKMKPTLSVTFEFKMSLRSEQEELWKHKAFSHPIISHLAVTLSVGSGEV